MGAKKGRAKCPRKNKEQEKRKKEKKRSGRKRTGKRKARTKRSSLTHPRTLAFFHISSNIPFI